MLTLNAECLKGFVSVDELAAIFPSVRMAHDNLHNHKKVPIRIHRLALGFTLPASLIL